MISQPDALQPSAAIHWSNNLQRPDPQRVQALLAEFWRDLRRLADLITRHEHLLAEECTAKVRKIVLEMMLALNGIQCPADTIHLNQYLGESQRMVLEKTLLAPHVSAESWIGRAVALTVIYRWYAPQLAQKFGLLYPQEAEEETLILLQQRLPDWPLEIRTE
jgi:hypothetical protein